MTSVIERFAKSDIRSNKLHKETALAAIASPEILREVAAGLAADTKVIRAACAGTFAETTALKPELGLPYVTELIKALSVCPEPQTRWESINALGNIGAIDSQVVEEAIPLICESMYDPQSACVRGYAVMALGEIGGADRHMATAVFPHLKQAMEFFCDTGDAHYVAEALAKLGAVDSALKAEIVEMIRPLLDAPKPSTVKRVRRALKSLGVRLPRKPKN